MKFSTKAIHVGNKPDPVTGAIISPIYQTSTYFQQSPNEHKGFDYTRAGNPNFSNLEATLATLENGKYATVFSSGMGALTSLFSTLKSNDKIVASNDLYGGTIRVLNQVFQHFNIKTTYVDMSNLKDTEELIIKTKPKIVYMETPSNPLLKIYDINTISSFAHQAGSILTVDNTFASPYFQTPLELGADVVIHSNTKYIGGHSDVLGGVFITNDESLNEKVTFMRKSMGFNPSPFDTWLTSRSLKTLEVRMMQHEKNAFAVANFLESHSKVKKVFYPGLKNNPYHNIAKKQMKGFSGMVSIDFDLDLETTKKLISNFTIFTLAESLGGVESLVDHPSSMTHASIPREDRIKNGLNDGLIRFSVGIENEEDLLHDIEQTIQKHI